MNYADDEASFDAFLKNEPVAGPVTRVTSFPRRSADHREFLDLRDPKVRRLIYHVFSGHWKAAHAALMDLVDYTESSFSLRDLEEGARRTEAKIRISNTVKQLIGKETKDNQFQQKYKTYHHDYTRHILLLIELASYVVHSEY